MSKASDFSEACSNMSFCIHKSIEVGTVTRFGSLLIGNLSTQSTITMDPKDGIALAHWILDTFSEPGEGRKEGGE